MKVMRFFVILLMIPTIASAQVSVSGRVELCEGFLTTLSIPGKLTFKEGKRRKSKHVERTLDTLLASFDVFQNDELKKQYLTDARGNFIFYADSNSSYKLRFRLHSLIYTETVLYTQTDDISDLTVCLSDTSWHNHFLRKIPFDSIKAKSDLESGLIQLVRISGYHRGCSLSIMDYFTPEDVAQIEHEFGLIFRNVYIEDKLPAEYLHQRETEYNAIVYRYLDDIYKGDSNEIIMATLIDRFKQKKAE